MRVKFKDSNSGNFNKYSSYPMDTFDTQKTLSAFRLATHKYIVSDPSTPAEYKKVYYYLLINLIQGLKNEIYFDEYVKNLREALNVDESAESKNYKLLAKKYKNTQKDVSRTYIYMYPLILESGFLLALQGDFDANTWLDNIKKSFNLKSDVIKWFKKYFSILRNGDYENLHLHYKSIKNIPYLRRSIKHVYKAILQILKYERLTQKHIAVISTMSSGKSTFINALIGNEIFPETQAACTAKITSIYDNDSLSNINGIALYGKDIKQAKIAVDKNIAKSWNDDNGIGRIVFEGNLKNVFNHNQVVVVHDTPGTNFSSDEEHKKITINFLENTKLDAIICLINAMYIGTNDSLEILRQIYKVTSNKNTKILFVLNKIDSIDAKREDTKDVLEKVKAFIEGIGFKNPMLIITSAKAVRLFKMALGGMADKFSEDEEDDFGIFLRKFLKGKTDRKTYKKIKVGEKECFKEDIVDGLKNTNFHIIEKIINKGEQKW